MSLSDSTNTIPKFLEIHPDWLEDIRLTQQWWTDISLAWSGAEQRARRRELPTYQFIYRYNAMNLGTFSARHMAQIQEMGAPIVVPIWTHRFDFVSETANIVTVDAKNRQLTKAPFRVGQYAYFEDPAGVLLNTFRVITAIDDTNEKISFEAAPVAFPSGESVQAYSAAYVYPALLGVRNESTFQISRQRVNLTDEVLDFAQL